MKMKEMELTVKFESVESLEETFKEIIKEIKEGYENNYDGLTEKETFEYFITEIES
jgi:tRNA A-37 threonylcarbamoyl transferase component Bud32